jgi:hypothetical protein
VNGAQNVRCRADFLQSQALVDFGRGLSRSGEIAYLFVVVRGFGDGLFENRGVCRHSEDPFADPLFEPSREQEIPADGIEPKALPQLRRSVQNGCVHCRITPRVKQNKNKEEDILVHSSSLPGSSGKNPDGFHPISTPPSRRVSQEAEFMF